MICGRRLLKKLDSMLDDALAGTFSAVSYDEKLFSKIESKMSRFLEQSRLRREHTEQEQDRIRSLISDISHQTKTPLANITLYTGLLAEQDLSTDQLKLAGQIAKSAEKLDFLIQALVKTSRLENGILTISPTVGNVYDVVDAAVAEGLSLAAAKHIRLSCESGMMTDDARDDRFAGQPVYALLDKRWCTEALFNIIDNAVKYTPENGSVTVTVREYEMFVRIDVKDTGRGIAETDLPKVFGRFWRSAAAADSLGVGVGLYLAREIIIACGGYVKAASQERKGSVFSVFLPTAFRPSATSDQR